MTFTCQSQHLKWSVPAPSPRWAQGQVAPAQKQRSPPTPIRTPVIVVYLPRLELEGNHKNDQPRQVTVEQSNACKPSFTTYNVFTGHPCLSCSCRSWRFCCTPSLLTGAYIRWQWYWPRWCCPWPLTGNCHCQKSRRTLVERSGSGAPSSWPLPSRWSGRCCGCSLPQRRVVDCPTLWYRSGDAQETRVLCAPSYYWPVLYALLPSFLTGCLYSPSPAPRACARSPPACRQCHAAHPLPVPSCVAESTCTMRAPCHVSGHSLYGGEERRMTHGLTGRPPVQGSQSQWPVRPLPPWGLGCPPAADCSRCRGLMRRYRTRNEGAGRQHKRHGSFWTTPQDLPQSAASAAKKRQGSANDNNITKKTTRAVNKLTMPEDWCRCGARKMREGPRKREIARIVRCDGNEQKGSIIVFGGCWLLYDVYDVCLSILCTRGITTRG